MPPEPLGRSPRLFFYVQHLLGIGHVHRAARIARALAADNFEVLVVLGGVPQAGLDFGDADTVQLTPVKAGPDGFAALVQVDGTPFDAEAAEGRTRQLLAAFDRFAPDILLTEAFPFGRSQMRFELLPLLDRAKKRTRPPFVASSVRDILQRDRRPARVAQTLDLVAHNYDLVLVHGDPALAALAQSFPEAHAFADKVVHTGLVGPDRIGRSHGARRYGAVVSAGGGAVGAALLEAAVDARALTRIADRPWLVLTGPNLPPAAAERLDGRRTPGVTIQRFVPDLAQILADADVSISQAGYNTVADILAARCPAVLVPYGRDGETEQGDRAALLERHGRATVVTERSLSRTTLAEAVEHALDRSPVTSRDFAIDGAQRTASVLRRALRARHPGASGGPS